MKINFKPKLYLLHLFFLFADDVEHIIKAYDSEKVNHKVITICTYATKSW